jgi:hypothetical protein
MWEDSCSILFERIKGANKINLKMNSFNFVYIRWLHMDDLCFRVRIVRKAWSCRDL